MGRKQGEFNYKYTWYIDGVTAGQFDGKTSKYYTVGETYYMPRKCECKHVHVDGYNVGVYLDSSIA